LRRAIENLLEDPLSEDLLRGSFAGADTIVVRADGAPDNEDAKLIMEGKKSEKPAEQPAPAELAAASK
jgi:ATP-dependent Clp protease ATP-binding subunit ClpC